MKKIKWYWIPIIGVIITLIQDVDSIHDDFFEEEEDYYGSMYVQITSAIWITIWFIIEIIKLA